jgi:hypothetical protein
MERPPELAGERVLQFASLARCQPTGGVKGPNLAALLIVRTDAEPHCVYLYHCDSDWNVVYDSWHKDVASALQQADYDYRPAPKFQEVAPDG